jgi:hypothetical protein
VRELDIDMLGGGVGWFSSSRELDIDLLVG